MLLGNVYRNRKCLTWVVTISLKNIFNLEQCGIAVHTFLFITEVKELHFALWHTFHLGAIKVEKIKWGGLEKGPNYGKDF